MSSIINKVKDALHHDNSTTTTSTTTTHTTGHGHNTAGAGTGTAEGVHGPHGSRIANAADPRVDSDRDGQIGANSVAPGQTGSAGLGHNTHTTGTTGGLGSTGAGYGATGTHTGNHGSTLGHTGDRGGISNSTNAGPHNSNLANKLDPRVDSDLDSTGNRHGASTHGGILGSSGTHATPGSGTAQNTAGPHNSDTLNKLDPRVDADLDGSRVVGGNKTNS